MSTDSKVSDEKIEEVKPINASEAIGEEFNEMSQSFKNNTIDVVSNFAENISNQVDKFASEGPELLVNTIDKVSDTGLKIVKVAAKTAAKIVVTEPILTTSLVLTEGTTALNTLVDSIEKISKDETSRETFRKIKTLYNELIGLLKETNEELKNNLPLIKEVIANISLLIFSPYIISKKVFFVGLLDVLLLIHKNTSGEDLNDLKKNIEIFKMANDSGTITDENRPKLISSLIDSVLNVYKKYNKAELKLYDTPFEKGSSILEKNGGMKSETSVANTMFCTPFSKRNFSKGEAHKISVKKIHNRVKKSIKQFLEMNKTHFTKSRTKGVDTNKRNFSKKNKYRKKTNKRRKT